MATLEHGIHGHLNSYVLDENDECTGKGAHRRCTVYGSIDDATREETGVDVVCDMDVPHLMHLPVPTPSQAMAVAMGGRLFNVAAVAVGAVAFFFFL